MASATTANIGFVKPAGVVVSTTVKFDSKVHPGVTFTLYRMTAGRRAQLEHSLLSYTNKVTDMYINLERVKDAKAAEAKSAASKKSRSKVDINVMDITAANSAVTGESDVERDDTGNITSDAKPAANGIDNWDDVSQRRATDNAVAAISISELRPIYLKIYLRRVTGLSVEVELDNDDNFKLVDVVTADDVIAYATNDLVEEIFYTIYNSNEPGMSLSALELGNLQLPTISANSTGGQQSAAVSSIAPDAKSKETTSA